MDRTTRRVGVAVAGIAVLAWAWSAGATQCAESSAGPPPLTSADARVRGGSGRLAAAIRGAAAGSSTFHRLVDQIGATDGVVYVLEGHCKRGLRACLILDMSVMGSNRVLWVRIDPRKMDRDLMGSIGHELQHALEVLSHSTIRSGSAMILLYNKDGSREGGHFETDAAIKMGRTVRAELAACDAANRGK